MCRRYCVSTPKTGEQFLETDVDDVMSLAAGVDSGLSSQYRRVLEMFEAESAKFWMGKEV